MVIDTEKMTVEIMGFDQKQKVVIPFEQVESVLQNLFPMQGKKWAVLVLDTVNVIKEGETVYVSDKNFNMKYSLEFISEVYEHFLKRIEGADK